MSNWINRLDIKDLWEAKDKNKITLKELALGIAKRIENMPIYNKEFDMTLVDIVNSFEMIEDDIEEFDECMRQLYDWGDIPLPTPKGQMQRKMCWIATTF